MTMFYVEPGRSVSGGGTPKRVTYALHSLLPPTGDANNGTGRSAIELPLQAAVAAAHQTPLTQLAPEVTRYWLAQLRTMCQTLCALVHYYKRHRSRTQLRGAWRKKQKAAAAAQAGTGDTSSGGGGSSGGSCGAPPGSKLDKLARSVRGRLVDAFSQAHVDPLLSAVVECVEAHWP